MGATPNSSKLELRQRASGLNGNGELRPSRMPADYAPGREALQALLAFSSLHEQVRRRKTYATQGGESLSAGPWAPDEFVLDEVLQLVSERALATSGADGVAIALGVGDQILCRASAGTLGPSPGARLDPKSGFSGACYRTGLVVRCDDANRDPRVDREICQRMGVRSMVAVPLLAGQGVIGLLEGFCSEPYGFNDSDVRSLSLLAELILAALRPQEDSRSKRDAAPNAFETIQRIEAGAAQAPQTAEAKGPDKPEAVAAAGELPNFETLRDALAPVTEDNGKVAATSDNSRASIPQQLFSQYIDGEGSDSKSGKRGIIAFLLVVLVLALAGGAVLWWRTHHRLPFQMERAETAASSMPPQAALAPPPVPAAAAPAEKDAQQSQITGIRHWSSNDSSTVAIDLQDQVQYEAHRLTDPGRIYFDLHDTTVGAGVPANIEVGDELLVRIRVAQPTPGVTRVVMETKNNPNFSVSLEPNPYRLVVAIHSISAKPKNAGKIDLFAPMHREPERGLSIVAKSGRWMAPPVGNSVQRGHAPKFRLVLDAGHGGWDKGTVGRRGLLEKDLVLDIVARLGNLVAERLGGEVIYTRHDDTYISLENRTELANRSQADMFLSVHANYSDYPSARGVETYYTNTYSSVHAGLQETDVNFANVDIREKVQGSRHFAAEVQRELYHALAAKDRALRNRGVREASYVVLTGTTMPAVLAEVSFVSSPTDEMSLQSAAYRQRIAEALYKGVADYAAGLHRVNLASTAPRPSGQ
jgi:N-acetylmuramoyl-L-alanine amidase/GAF domain-containing protein